MQPCSREMQAMNSLLNQTQMSLQELQNHHQQIDPSQIHHQFDPPPSSHDEFLDQMLSSLPSSSWPDLAAGGIPKSPWDLSSNPMLAAAIGLNKSRGAAADEQDNVSQHQTHFDHDQSALLAAKLRQHQIGGGANSAVKNLLMQQQMMLQSRGFGGGGGLPSPNGGSGDSGLLPMPLSLGGDDVDVSSFKAPSPGDGTVQALFSGFSGSLHQTPNPHFQHPQGQNYGGAQGPATNQAPAASGSTGGASAQPRQRVRARRGQATDPHSIAERLRRERIAERMKALQELVPNANKTDKASMLDEIIDYVKFLQLQVKVLSMSRLGGASAVAPLVADMSSEGGRVRGGNGTQTASTSSANDAMTVTEHQVAKLMEEDMGTAMQYLQGKGLCLMPISLATAISSATSRNPMSAANNNNNPLLAENGGGPTSPNLSALTVQSATMGNGGTENAGKDAISVSDP